MKCGHKEPDVDHLSWKAYYPTDSDKVLVLDLQTPNQVRVIKDSLDFLNNESFHPFSNHLNWFDKSQLMWTMIYDEGFEVRIHGNKFFGFSAFYPVDMPHSR